MSYHKTIWIALACAMFAWRQGIAQSGQFMSWSLDEGLPQSQVYSLCEDAYGFLWLGTQGGGVCRFDGQQFEVFGPQNGLSNTFVNVLAPYGKQVVAGTNAGLFILDNQHVQLVPESAGLSVYALLAVPEGILLGTQKGVWKYDAARRTCTPVRLNPVLDKLIVLSLAAHPEGGFWIGSVRGLWYSPKENEAISVNASAQIPPNPVSALVQQGNTLWCGTLGSGIMAISADSRRLIRSVSAQGLERVVCLMSADDGTLWAGTPSDGVFQVAASGESVVRHFTEMDGLPHSHIHALLQDRNGRIWLGTSGAGLALAGGQAFRRYDRSDGLPGNRIYAVQQDGSGQIWISASQHGLARLDSMGWHAVTADSGYLQGVKTRSLAVDTAGQLWIGTEGKGVLVLGKNGRLVLKKDNGFLPSDWIQKIICEPDGGVWVATAEGLVLFSPTPEGYRRRWFDVKEGMPGASVTTLHLDAAGVLWFGTLNGRAGNIRNHSIVTVFGAKEGIPATVLTSIATDTAGQVWIATKGEGIVKGVGQPVSRFESVYGSLLSSRNIYLLLRDKSGQLWAGTESGVDRLCFSADGSATVKHFGRNEGFTGIETCQDAALCDAAGQLWFGTLNGLMRCVNQDETRGSTPPLVHFEQISLFYKPLEPGRRDLLFDSSGAGLVLPWDQNHLSFAFRAVDLLPAGAARYRWKLEEADTDWSPWTEQAQVNYANLAPGRYRLLVQATTDGITFSEPVFAVFTIQKPFWEEWYFRLGALVLFLLLLAAGVRYYTRQIRKRERARREKLEVAHKLLQLEQKALQLQMNPHFLFNALNSIQALVATREYEVARSEIGNFARLMRSILYNSRRQQITLKEETETLEQYLRMEQFCQANPFTFTLSMSAELDPEEVTLPPMLLQPFVENAVVHGVAHLSYPGHIQIHFTMEADQLCCTIEDNGIGREKAALLREAKKPGHQSTALQVTRERIEALGGSLAYSDLPEAGGTRVRLTIPVTIAF
ncbi:MAG: histidine kinase [Saprospiraceae bacterium]|nr:histidine kinase [Saprospiraceae bacterium]